MVCEWEMSDKVKNLFCGENKKVFIEREYKTQKNYSEKIAAIIDSEIQKIIHTNYERAMKALNDNLDILENMVKLLFERETIYSDEVDMLVQRKSLEEINKYIDDKQEKKKEYDKKNNTNPSPFSPSSTIIVQESAPQNKEPQPVDEGEKNKTDQTNEKPQNTGDNKENTEEKEKETKDNQENK